MSSTKISFIFNIAKVKRSIDVVNKLKVDRGKLTEIGRKTKKHIDRRTASGKDVNNKQFAPYKGNYKRGQKPNLILSRQMLNAMRSTTRVTSSGFRLTLYFVGGRNIMLARVHDRGDSIGRGNFMTQRNFIGISSNRSKEIRREVKAIYVSSVTTKTVFSSRL